MAIGKDTVITNIDGRKGIHYRPHRVDPDNYVVVKIYLKYPDTYNEKQTRKILTDYLSDMGESKAKITRGSVKWVAIIPKDSLKKKKSKQRSKSSAHMSTSQKAKAKAKAKESGSSQAKEKKYILDMPGQKQKQYVGQSSSSSSGLKWKPSGKYSLEWVEIVAERLEG